MEIFFLILNTCANTFMMSQLFAYIQEVEVGGGTNRQQTALFQFIMLANASVPAFSLFETAPLWLTLAYWGGFAVVMGVNTVAAICHKNQIYRNAEQENEIIPLPYDLHLNPKFSWMMLTLANNLSYPILFCYVAGLISAGFYLSPWLLLASASTLFVNYAYQKGWFPKFLENIYFFATTILMTATVFDLKTKVGLVLTFISVAFLAYDYIQTHLRGVNSGSAQYDIAKPEHHLSVEEVLKDTPDEKVEPTIKKLITKLSPREIKITYNHFQQSWVVSNKLLGNQSILKPSELKEFDQLFHSLDFNSQNLRDSVIAEMLEHDNFQKEDKGKLKKELGLHETATDEELCIAFLKNEIKVMVTKLSKPDYKGLTAEQVGILYGHVRGILNHIKNPENQADKAPILLSLGIRTGAQCLRMYLETFTELGHKYTFNTKAAQETLTLKERAVLAAQTLREKKFEQYFRVFTKQLKEESAMGAVIYGFLYSDNNEYHTHEQFALSYGSYFYLRNPSLSVRRRDLLDILVDKCNYLIFSCANLIPGSRLLFSDFYNAKALTEDVLTGGLLSPIFQAWCLERSLDYNDLVLDENLTIKNNDAKVISLVKLFLVDLDLVEYTEPLKSTETVVSSNPFAALFASSQPSSKVTLTDILGSQPTPEPVPVPVPEQYTSTSASTFPPQLLPIMLGP